MFPHVRSSSHDRTIYIVRIQATSLYTKPDKLLINYIFSLFFTDKLNRITAMYKMKLTDVIKNMNKGKDPVHPEVRRTLLSALQKAINRLWAAK